MIHQHFEIWQNILSLLMSSQRNILLCGYVLQGADQGRCIALEGISGTATRSYSEMGIFQALVTMYCGDIVNNKVMTSKELIDQYVTAHADNRWKEGRYG